MVRVKLFMAKSSQICDDAFDIKMTFSYLITGRVLILNWALQLTNKKPELGHATLDLRVIIQRLANLTNQKPLSSRFPAKIQNLMIEHVHKIHQSGKSHL